MQWGAGNCEGAGHAMCAACNVQRCEWCMSWGPKRSIYLVQVTLQVVGNVLPGSLNCQCHLQCQKIHDPKKKILLQILRDIHAEIFYEGEDR